MHFENADALLAWLMVWMSKTFPAQAILKGGMVLRLLESARNTNDLDWVFLPFASRKDVAPLVRSELDKVKGLRYHERLDSRSLQYRIEYGGQNAQIEISVNLKCKSTAMSTARYAAQFGFVGGIVRVMEPATALAHKLAAWNERRLYRDLYDIWFLSRIQKAKPDLPTLLDRLTHVEQRRKKPRSMTLAEFCAELEVAADRVTMKAILDELGASMKATDLEGLDVQIPVALRLMAAHLSPHAQ
jgi:predicted nucleotidyltransferase component of viral defense system